MAAKVKHEVWERGHGAAPTSAVMTRDVQLVQTNDQGKAAPRQGPSEGQSTRDNVKFSGSHLTGAVQCGWQLFRMCVWCVSVLCMCAVHGVALVRGA